MLRKLDPERADLGPVSGKSRYISGQVERSFSNCFSDPKTLRDFRETGHWGANHYATTPPDPVEYLLNVASGTLVNGLFCSYILFLQFRARDILKGIFLLSFRKLWVHRHMLLTKCQRN